MYKNFKARKQWAVFQKMSHKSGRWNENSEVGEWGRKLSNSSVELKMLAFPLKTLPGYF